jgi:hypothetical protein
MKMKKEENKAKKACLWKEGKKINERRENVNWAKK